MAGCQAALATNVVKLIAVALVAVAGRLITKVVAFVMEATTAPAAIPVPWIGIPTDNNVVLLPVTIVDVTSREPGIAVVAVPLHWA